MKHSYPHPRGRQKIAPTQYFIRSAPLVIKIVPRPTITPLENICTTKTRAAINCVFYCVQLEMLIDEIREENLKVSGAAIGRATRL